MNSELLTLTKELVLIESIASKPDNLKKVVDLVEDYFHDSNLIIKRFEQNQKHSIVISNQDVKEFDVLMMGHLDVVPAKPEMFIPTEEEGKLIGRGTADMKAAVAVMMKIMKEETPNMKKSVGLMLTTDEEIGGKHGADYLVNEIGYRAKVGLVPDGGIAPENVFIANKGVAHFKITTKGKTAHGSRPWLGENAIDKLFDGYTELIKNFENKDASVWKNTCSLGMISGGHAANAVPDFVECYLDIRFTEDHSLEEMKDLVASHLKDSEVELLAHGLPSATSEENEYIKYYAGSVKETVGADLCCERSHGGNDGRFLTQFGTPIIVSRPISGGQHEDGEWVQIDALEPFYKVYQGFLKRVEA